jgi:ABC-type amino acid transport substrate-binding protein
LPVVDAIAKEYGDDIAFVAIAWKGTYDDTAAQAANLMQSGKIDWALDDDAEIFSLYGVPYQPVSFLITGDNKVFDTWPGVRDEAAIRQALDSLLDL